MPSLSFGKTMGASELGYNPLNGWQFEYLPWPAAVKLLIACTDANCRITDDPGAVADLRFRDCRPYTGRVDHPSDGVHCASWGPAQAGD